MHIRKLGGVTEVDGGFSALDVTVEAGKAPTVRGQQSVGFYLKTTQMSLVERTNSLAELRHSRFSRWSGRRAWCGFKSSINVDIFAPLIDAGGKTAGGVRSGASKLERGPVAHAGAGRAR